MAGFLLGAILGSVILRSPEGAGGPGGPSPTPGTPPEPPTEESYTLTKSALEDRVKRGQRSLLKSEFGVESADALKARLARAEELEKAEEARKAEAAKAEREKMDAIERSKLEKQEAEARAKQLADDLAQERLGRHIAEEAARLGIKDLSYAEYLIASETTKLPEGQQLNVKEFLVKQLESPARKAALGLEEPVIQVPDPASTTPQPPNAPPPPPPAGGGNQQPADAFALDANAWENRKRALGVM